VDVRSLFAGEICFELHRGQDDSRCIDPACVNEWAEVLYINGLVLV
jgi:hypothetical protein